MTFIVDPVLSGDEIKSAASKYSDLLKENGCNIVHIDEMGLRQLAYPINRRSSGIYYCIEFQSENGAVIGPLELSMKRDDNVLRFLTVALDKYGIKYNEDKRAGLIGKTKKKEKKEDRRDGRKQRSSSPAPKAEAKAAPAAKPAEKAAETPAPKPEPKPVEKVAEAPAPEKKAEAKDDLKKVEGIGPKIEEILNAAGIATFAQLAEAGADKVRDILAEAGDRYKAHDPTTWSNQAGLAAKGNWDELKELQDKLDGGREVTDSSEEE